MFWNAIAARAARDPPQRAALVAHDPRHRHRRRGRHHDGHDRRGRDGAGAGRHPEARHEPAAGVSRPGFRRRRRRALRVAAVHDGGRARDRERDLRRARRGAELEHAGAGDLRQLQLVDAGHRHQRQVPRSARLAAGVGPQFLRVRAARRRGGLPARRHGASRSCSATRIRSARASGCRSCRARSSACCRSKGQSGFGQNQDDIVVMPLRTLQRRMAGNADVNAIMVSARDGVSTEKVQADIERLLRERRKIRDGADDDFNVRDLKEVTSAFTSSTRVLTALLGAVAAVSLIVGGVGIMNIMLVSVTERTREIGTRLAVGAMARDVLLQFLVEAVTLAAFGGIIGIVLGLSAGGARDQRVQGAVRVQSRHRDPVVRVLRRGRHRVRLLPGPARRAARSDRGVAARVGSVQSDGVRAAECSSRSAESLCVRFRCCARAAARCPPATVGARTRRGGRAGSACALRPSNAARDPWVWAPLLGAAAFQIDDLDRRTADWAREHTPVFGSQRNAEQWSDDLRTASVLAHYATIVATPSGDDFGEWLAQQGEGHAGRRRGRQRDGRDHALAEDRSRPRAAERRRTTRAFLPVTLRHPRCTRGSRRATCSRSTCRTARAARSMSACMR